MVSPLEGCSVLVHGVFIICQACPRRAVLDATMILKCVFVSVYHCFCCVMLYQESRRLRAELLPC